MYRNVVDFLQIENSAAVDMHINGNAIYCLVSDDFDLYRAKVIKRFPPMGCNGHADYGQLGGFDHAMYRFRLLRESREYMKGKFSKFRIDDFIMNFGESKYDRKERAD